MFQLFSTIKTPVNLIFVEKEREMLVCSYYFSILDEKQDTNPHIDILLIQMRERKIFNFLSDNVDNDHLKLFIILGVASPSKEKTQIEMCFSIFSSLIFT